jgi:hypothetical protein
VLKTDAKYRTPGVKDDLIVMKKIEFKPWDFTIPTITQFVSDDDRNTELKASTVRKNLLKALPFLKNIKWDNILLAGGAVTAFVNPYREPVHHDDFNDLDFFIYGLTVNFFF